MPRSKQPEPPVTPYHHGDLRQALLDSARAILADTGRWDFSLREVARHAGVSHNAPYRHFADKEALLAAIGVLGYGMLAAENATATKGLHRPADVLAASGKAYLAFGVANPGLYRLMFGQALPNVAGLPSELLEAIAVARSDLHGVIVAGAQDGSFALDANAPDQTATASVAAWSLVHGLTLLMIDRIVERDTGADTIANLPAQVINLFVAGLRARTDP